MMNIITRWWQACKERSGLAEQERIKRSFRISERNGALWITHNGVAVNMVPPFASSEEVIKMLEETKACAVEYEFGKDENPNNVLKADMFYNKEEELV